MNFWKHLFDKNQKGFPDQARETKSEAEPPPPVSPIEKTIAPQPLKQGMEGSAQKGKAQGTIPWRTFHIFVSSTFKDMQAERDHLKNIVFPKVEEELRKKRIKLETVDLRWGVDTASVEEDERETTVLKVCLDEIERCKPFFIGLLGDRYGWVPPEERMKSATLGKKLLLPDKGKSVTALEIEFGVLANPGQLHRSVFYFREPLPYGQLSPEKAAKFSDQYDPSLAPDEKMMRKIALVGLKSAIKDFFTEINQPGRVKSYTTGFSKGSKLVVTGLEAWGDMVYADILAECKSHAQETWDQVPRNKHGQELALLEAFIEEHTHISKVKTGEGEEQVHTFCGREKLVKELKQHILSTGKGDWGLALTGESGAGKSAVFAMMYKIMREEGCLVLAHSAGISPQAKSVAELLHKWNRQLRGFLGLKEEGHEEPASMAEQHLGPEGLQKTAPKLEIEKLQERFAELLYQAATNTKVVLLMDALDRFEPTSRARYMTWLPGPLPDNARLMVTAITGTEIKAVQYHRGLVSRGIDHFTEGEAGEMLHSLCKKQHKDLPVRVKKALLEKQREDGLKAAASPLWLSLAVNMLMAMDADDFEKMSGQQGKGGEQIEDYMLGLANKFPTLPGELFLDLIKKAAGLTVQERFHSLFRKADFYSDQEETPFRENEQAIVKAVAEGIQKAFEQYDGLQASDKKAEMEHCEDFLISNEDAAADLPRKLRMIHCGLRRFKDQRPNTPDITDQEVEKLARHEHGRWCRERKIQGWKLGDKNITLRTTPHLLAFEDLPEGVKEFNLQMVYVLPVILKDLGYEVYRMEESERITEQHLIHQLSQALHADYIEQRKKEGDTPEKNAAMVPSDQLPEDFKQANRGSAETIPRKLQLIGYELHPVQPGENPPLLHLTEDEIEQIAQWEHTRWSWEKRFQGWVYKAGEKNAEEKTSPYLLPWSELPEKIRERDREPARLIPQLLQQAGYKAVKRKDLL